MKSRPDWYAELSARIKNRPPSLIALLLQFAAVLIVALFIHLSGLTLTPITAAIVCGLIAALLSHLAGLALWWRIILLLFAPALVLMLALAIPPHFYLIAFLLMLVVYWSTFRTQVPLYLSSQKVWQALESLLPNDRPFRFMDLGSGLGGVLLHLSHTHPQGHYSGVETAPLPYLWSWLRLKLRGCRNCAVHWGSLWDSPLGEYDVVFAYLSPVPMQDLWQKVRTEMRPGSLFISNTFAIPDSPPDHAIKIDDLHGSTLYVWRLP